MMDLSGKTLPLKLSLSYILLKKKLITVLLFKPIHFRQNQSCALKKLLISACNINVNKGSCNYLKLLFSNQYFQDDMTVTSKLPARKN